MGAKFSRLTDIVNKRRKSESSPGILSYVILRSMFLLCSKRIFYTFYSMILMKSRLTKKFALVVSYCIFCKIMQI